MAPRDRDEYDQCEHGIELDEYCEKCETDEEELFDADELGLDPELDAQRKYGSTDA
jgi:hypothetical protein